MRVLIEIIFARGHPYFPKLLTCKAPSFTSSLIDRRFKEVPLKSMTPYFELLEYSYPDGIR